MAALNSSQLLQPYPYTLITASASPSCRKKAQTAFHNAIEGTQINIACQNGGALGAYPADCSQGGCRVGSRADGARLSHCVTLFHSIICIVYTSEHLRLGPT